MRHIADRPADEDEVGRLFEAVLDNAPVGLAFYDRDHLQVRVNESYAPLVGVDLGADVDQVFVTGAPLLNREVVLDDGQQWLLSHYPVSLDDKVTWVGTVATNVSLLRRTESERADLLDAERRARAAAERMAMRLARLQAVTARLTGAADADEVARVVCDHGAAGLGAVSGALMLLVDDGTAFEMVRQTGYPAAIQADFGRFDADAPLPACDAVRTRSMVLLSNLAERDQRYPALADTPVQHQAHAIVPLLFGDSALGAMSFAFHDVREFDDDDRRFLLAVASQASQALERARLHDVERDAARRQHLLAETSGLLATAADLGDAIVEVARLLIDELVDACAVDVVDGPAVRVGAGDDEVTTRITIPLRTSANELGALTLARRTGDFRAPDFALATEIADRMAIALDNARVHRSRAEQAQTLQASLLPPRLPEIDGLTIDSRYQPVGDGSLVGGDFYDVFPMGEGRWGLLIGDVCGQGVVAASLTSLVRYTVRAAARQWSSPAEILRFANSTIMEHDIGERFCTTLLGVIEPDASGAQLTLAIGGHHRPLVHRPSRGVRPIGTMGTALGLLPHPSITDHLERLEPGDTLVFFTDGVIEARHPDGEQVREGFLESLVEASAAGGPAAVGATVEGAVLDLGGGRSNDDMALLVIGVGARDEAQPHRDGNFDRRLPAEVESVRVARNGVREWLEVNALVPERRDDLLLAITELATNAVRAARTAMEVRAWTTPEAVFVEVTDDGAGFDASIPHTARELDPLAERGRGLFLVATLADECTIESGPSGTIVRCAVSR